jgi:hypothetical protein
MTQDVVQPIDYSYRPSSYWDAINLRQVVANIKGAERKKLALRLMKERRLEEASDLILADCLSNEDRVRLSELHPALMGGEFLPEYLADEVEIARVTMASVTTDVIGVRARPENRRIAYRAVDEYDSRFVIRPRSSLRPLSLRQLISLIDTGRDSKGNAIGLGIVQTLLDCTEEPAAAFAGFLEFSSEFYPDLSEHYRMATQQWLAENRKRRGV